jgi:hypothetical protein
VTPLVVLARTLASASLKPVVTSALFLPAAALPDFAIGVATRFSETGGCGGVRGHGWLRGRAQTGMRVVGKALVRDASPILAISRGVRNMVGSRAC